MAFVPQNKLLQPRKGSEVIPETIKMKRYTCSHQHPLLVKFHQYQLPVVNWEQENGKVIKKYHMNPLKVHGAL